jgi:hypothetical protein
MFFYSKGQAAAVGPSTPPFSQDVGTSTTASVASSSTPTQAVTSPTPALAVSDSTPAPAASSSTPSTSSSGLGQGITFEQIRPNVPNWNFPLIQDHRFHLKVIYFKTIYTVSNSNLL